MAGILLCVFFAFGVLTGFSTPGRQLLSRARLTIQSWSARIGAAIGISREAVNRFDQSIVPLEVMFRLRPAAALMPPPAPIDPALARDASDTVAMLERRDGFYALAAGGALRGPLSPSTQPDLPILSGPAAESGNTAELLQDAALLVRAEAELSSVISEAYLEDDGTMALYLNRPRIEVITDRDGELYEINRAREVLAKWRGRENLLAALDMTTPGMAVARLRSNLRAIDRSAMLAHTRRARTLR